jgi:hypothetical protein
MKIILILYLCSYTSGSCLPGYQVSETFNDLYDCMSTGYEESMKKMEEVGREDVNEHEIFIRFACVKEEENSI